MIDKINDKFRASINEHIEIEWAGPIIVTKGIVHNTSNSDGLMSIENNELQGYVLFKITNKYCEILVLQSFSENQGIGSALINAVISEAKASKCNQVWLITTNDNIHAIRFYQKFGFELIGVHLNALDASRKLKPTIPLIGNENIPLKHEFEFSFLL